MPRPRIIRLIQAIESPPTTAKLHPRNKHQGRYDLQALSTTHPDLQPFVEQNEYGAESIDFFNPMAVKELNKALLMHFYRIRYWDIPEDYLVPPIPGRADYLHYAADLMSGNYPKKTTDEIPRGTQIRCLDIGVGANCIYPLLANKEYGWAFVGTDVDEIALTAAQKIIDMNGFEDVLELRKQEDKRKMFRGVVRESDRFDLSICNPPFHASLAEAKASSSRKIRNLTGKNETTVVQNFGGTNNELWYDGGEIRFITKYIEQSKEFSNQILWFTLLVSKQENVGKAIHILEKMEALNVQVIEMSQGSKSSRIIGWTFKNRKARKTWHKAHWSFN